MNPQHLNTILALAADHLRGVPLPTQPPAAMADLWGQIAAVQKQLQAMAQATAQQPAPAPVQPALPDATLPASTEAQP